MPVIGIRLRQTIALTRFPCVHICNADTGLKRTQNLYICITYPFQPLVESIHCENAQPKHHSRHLNTVHSYAVNCTFQ
eukprot:scaffold203403_cov25-Prasinocladus_malaysianus.AAC.1